MLKRQSEEGKNSILWREGQQTLKSLRSLKNLEEASVLDAIIKDDGLLATVREPIKPAKRD